MRIELHKDKNIGKVLFIVEGAKTEPYIMTKMFTGIFDYQLETKLRGKGYKQFNSKINPDSKIFVINTQQSNIQFIEKDDGYLNNLFKELIEKYDFDIDNAAIFYIFDRDDQSNTDSVFLENMLSKLVNSRDNPDYDRQGLILLSYPSIESFTLSCYRDNVMCMGFETGQKLKTFLGAQKINNQRIDEAALLHAASELLNALDLINDCSFDLDDFSECNLDVFHNEESGKNKNGLYQCMSLLIIALMDLGLVELISMDTSASKDAPSHI